jgi:hypothetical protein
MKSRSREMYVDGLCLLQVKLLSGDKSFIVVDDEHSCVHSSHRSDHQLYVRTNNLSSNLVLSSLVLDAR